MKINELLVEYRGGSWREIRSWVPKHWPDYVVKDWLYGKISNIPGLEDKKAHIDMVLKSFPVRQWRLETRELTLNSFIKGQQELLISRMKGEDLKLNIPRDAERHATQAAKIKTTGAPNPEPIICIAHGNQLELIEGWHRTTQNMLAFPDGYQSRVWVGYQ